ncbi:uncharacterized protein LOC127875045 isoform X2 [Dreissena polymorpha]|uniref:uncharacterized protein LOC127875045 isoform X2 n=1 Tax=Dreissena polymorpha TaxID=45954 RepID=UPI002265642C|nr:uncharacterized protein LOC127875045 isoform X2 [Dreissena polymorpha]
MDRRQKEIFNKVLPDFTNFVDPIPLLPYLDCLTEPTKEQIRNHYHNRSKNWANQELHSALLRRPKGYHQIVIALEHNNYSFIADRLDPDRAIRGPPIDQQTSSHLQSTSQVVRPHQSFAQEQITAPSPHLSTPPVHFTAANTNIPHQQPKAKGIQNHPNVMPNNQYQNTYEMPYPYPGQAFHPGMMIDQFQDQYHQPYSLPHFQGQPYYTNVMPNQFQGQPLVPGLFQGQPLVSGQFQRQPATVAGQFQGQPATVAGQFQGQLETVAGQFQEQPATVAGHIQGHPSLMQGQLRENPSAVSGLIQGQPAQFQGFFQGSPHEHPTNPFDQFQGPAQYFYATPNQEQGLIYHRIPILQQDAIPKTESSLSTSSMSSGIPTLTSESLKDQASTKSLRLIEERSSLRPGQSQYLNMKSMQLLENLQPSSVISGHSPGNIQPSSAISGQLPGNIQPSSAIPGHSPRNLQPSSAISGHSPGNIQPSSAISGQLPGNIQPSSVIPGQSPGNIQPSSAISGHSPGNIQPSSAISGQLPGNIQPSSLIPGQSPGNLQTSSAISGLSPDNIQPLSAISGQLPGNLQPSSAIPGQSPESIQPSSAISGQLAGNIQTSSAISGQSPESIQPSSAISGQLPGNLQPSSAIPGQSPGKLQPSSAISGQPPGNIQPSSAISGQSTESIQPSSAISGQLAGNIQPSSAISAQLPGNLQPSSAISGQSPESIQPSSAISGQSPGNLQPPGGQSLTPATLSQPDLPNALHECLVDSQSERATLPSQLVLSEDAAARVDQQVAADNRLLSQRSNLADAAESQPLTSQASPQAPVSRETFNSRFCEDFTMIKVLGKGAFGVVFEAEKKIDLQRYAVKRIKVKGKDVMPEVRALARLDDPGIVRYYHAWMETPPLGWQAEQDSHMEGLSSLTCSDDYPTETTSSKQQSDDETSNKQPAANTAPPRNAQLADLQNFGANNFPVFFVDDVRQHNKATESSVSDSYGWSTDGKSSIGTSSRDTKDDIDDNEVKKDKNEDDDNDDNEEGKDYKWQEDKDAVEDDDGIAFESSEASRKRKTEESKQKAENNNDDATKGGRSMDRRANDLDRQDKRLQQLSINPPNLLVPPSFLYIQTELCKAETLKDWLDRTKHRPSDVISKIVREITSPLAYIHDKKYIHKDLKPANIFFALDNSVKLGDFGLARIMAEDHVGSLDAGRVAKSHTAGVGTFFYMSPEQRGKKYTNKVDIFALGVIVFEMFHSFDSGSERAKMLEAARRRDFPEQFQVNHARWCDTLRQMLSSDPDNRPTAQQLLDSDLLRS